MAAQHAPPGAGAAAGDATARAPPPSTCPPASTGSSAAPARPGAGGESLPEALVAVSARAGLPLWIPPDVAGHCCATPWTSKGYERGARRMANHTIDALWRWSDGGELPIVCDASSCTLGLAAEAVPLLSEVNAERHAKLELLDSIAWAERGCCRACASTASSGSVAVHPPCASRHLELDRDAGGDRRRRSPTRSRCRSPRPAAASPATAACCTPSCRWRPTADEAAELAGRDFDAHLCSNRTCEIGLQQGTGRPYESFVFALEELSRGRPAG